MTTASTNICIDEGIRERAAELFEELGMSLSEAVNVFLKQSLLQCGLPFKVEHPDKKPNWATIRAMKEGERIARDPKAKKYTVEEFLEEMRGW